MSKPTDELNENQINVDSDSDENLEFTEDSENQGVITDAGEGTTFVADWETIEKNYLEANFGHHHSSRHHHHSSGHHHSGSGEHKHHHSSHSSDHSPKHHHNSSKKSSKKDKKDKKKWSKKKKIIVGILIFFLSIIIGILAAFFIMRWMGRKELTNYDNLNLM